MREVSVRAPIRAHTLGLSRATLYYKRKLPAKDAALRREIERVLNEQPSYGHKRLAQHLKINKK